MLNCGGCGCGIELGDCWVAMHCVDPESGAPVPAVASRRSSCALGEVDHRPGVAVNHACASAPRTLG